MKSQFTNKKRAKGYVKHLQKRGMYKNISIKRTKMKNVKGKPLGYTVYYTYKYKNL